MRALLLSAGYGSRLNPLTQKWPKCLMPINGIPLIEYWLFNLEKAGFKKIYINTHWLHNVVENYLKKNCRHSIPKIIYEEKLLGTAGTLRNIFSKKKIKNLLIAHADNFIDIDIKDLLDFHSNHKLPISMVIFKTEKPRDCGVTVLDANDIVIEFHEKVENPPTNLANAAIYIIDYEVIDYINKRPYISDFSTQVIPNYVGKIKAYFYNGINIDIGTFNELQKAQKVISKNSGIIKNRLTKINKKNLELKKIINLLSER